MAVTLYSEHQGESFVKEVRDAFLYADQIYKAVNFKRLSNEQFDFIYETFKGTSDIPIPIPSGTDGEYNEESWYSWTRHLFDLWNIDDLFYKLMVRWFAVNKKSLNEAQQELLHSFLLWFIGTQNTIDHINEFGNQVKEALVGSELFVLGDKHEGESTTVYVRVDLMGYNIDTEQFEILTNTQLTDWTWENSDGESGVCQVNASEYGTIFVTANLPRKKDGTVTIHFHNDTGLYVIGIEEDFMPEKSWSYKFEQDPNDDVTITYRNDSAFTNIWTFLPMVLFDVLEELVITENHDIENEPPIYDVYVSPDYSEFEPSGWKKVTVDVPVEYRTVYTRFSPDAQYIGQVEFFDVEQSDIPDLFDQITWNTSDPLSKFGVTRGTLRTNHNGTWPMNSGHYISRVELLRVPNLAALVYNDDEQSLRFVNIDIEVIE